MDDALTVQISRLAGPDARESVAALVAAALEVADGDPAALADLTATLRHRDARPTLERLPAATRRLLLIAAADPDLTADELARAADLAGLGLRALAPAERAHLVAVRPDGIGFAHPRLRTGAYDEAPVGDRRAAHRILATCLDPGRHRLRAALHRALATTGPDVALAEELADAAAAHREHRSAARALTRAADLASDPVRTGAHLVAAARRAWLGGDPAGAAGLLRRLHRAQPADAGPEGNRVLAEARLLAGEMALRTSTPDTALACLTEAAELFAATHARTSVPGDGDTTAVGRMSPCGAATAAEVAAVSAAGDRPVGEVSALLQAGEAICFSGDHFRYAGIAGRAARLHRPDGLAGLMLTQIAGFGALFDGRYRQAVPTLRGVVQLAGDPRPDRTRPDFPAATALTCASAAALAIGDDGAALRLAGRAVAVSRAEGDVSLVPRALELEAAALLWRGAYDAAGATALAGLRAAREAGQPNEEDSHLAVLALLAALRGDRPACLLRLRQLDALRADTADPRAGTGALTRPRALARWALAVLDLLADRPADAAARLGTIADPRTGRGHVLTQVMAAPDLVEAAARGGVGVAARVALTAFDRWASSTGEPLRRALSARCHALLARRGSPQAEEHFREALRLHLGGESSFERARTQLLFGRELRRFRRPRHAREHLREALETFVHAGASPWAVQARAELRVCGDDAPAPASVGARLTAQQLQIARLVAAGATNREVAAQLFLSTRTVDHHMRNIFTRLGITSRVALAKLVS